MHLKGPSDSKVVMVTLFCPLIESKNAAYSTSSFTSVY